MSNEANENHQLYLQTLMKTKNPLFGRQSKTIFSLHEFVLVIKKAKRKEELDVNMPSRCLLNTQEKIP